MANRNPTASFTKGDPRINRKGRPKTFDKLRALAQAIATEDGGQDKDGNTLTNVEFILRKMMKDDPKLFVEIAYGKVPVENIISGKPNAPLVIKWVDIEGEPD
jgi:hypothetical protein